MLRLANLDYLVKTRILITGGTGFFGKWILGFLTYANREKQLNLKIFALSRKPHPDTPFIKYILGDVRTFSFHQKVDFVIHAATEASAQLNNEKPTEMFDVITEGTNHLLDICKIAQPARILFTSSGAVYGDQAPEIILQPDDGATIFNEHAPTNAYAEGKRKSELLGALHAQKTKQSISFARCFAFVGPHLPLDTHFAVGNFINDCLNHREIVIKGDGSACRSYMYAADLVVWLLKILTHGENFRTYNVGSEESVSIGELANKVSQIWENISETKTEVKIKGIHQQNTPIHRYVPQTIRATSELALKLNYRLDESLERTIQFYLMASMDRR